MVPQSVEYFFYSYSAYSLQTSALPDLIEGLARNLDVELSTIEIRVNQVAARQVVGWEGVKVTPTS